MPATFYTLLTTAGQAKIANALATGGTVSLSQMAVGDGNGNPTTPNASQAVLLREKYRGSINELSVDPDNANYMYADLVIPTSEGGWTIHEVGLFCNDGTLFAVANFPATYKPTLIEGAARETVVRLYIEVTNVSTVTLVIDPTIVLASRSWVSENYSIAAQIPGGLTHQILRKKTNAHGDVEWFDPAGGFAVFVEVIEEHQTLSTSQTIVDLVSTTTDGLAVYIDGLRTFDWTALTETRLQLGTSYANGTPIDFVQNDPTAETQDIDLRVNRAIIDSGQTLNPADDLQLSQAMTAFINAKGFQGSGHGCRLSNNAADSNNDIDISSGFWMDSTNIIRMYAETGMTKRLDAAFAAGTNAGGLFTGSKANSTAYHVFLLFKADWTPDFGFDTTLNATNRPVAFPYYRRIGTIFTDTSGNIIRFRQVGDYFRFLTPVDAGVSLSTSVTTPTILVPPGLEIAADVQLGGTATGSSAALEYLISHPSDTPASIARMGVNGTSALSFFPTVQVLTDINRQFKCQVSVAGSLSGTFLKTVGYWDDRGKV